MEEARRQGMRLTDLAGGVMIRFMACVMRQVMTRSLPLAVAHCAKRRIKR